MTDGRLRSGKYSAKPSPAIVTEAKRFQIDSPTFRISQGLACPAVALVLVRARFGRGAASARGRFDLPCDSATIACAWTFGADAVKSFHLFLTAALDRPFPCSSASCLQSSELSGRCSSTSSRSSVSSSAPQRLLTDWETGGAAAASD